MDSRAQNNIQDLVLKGTETVPGLGFLGDNNTGIYSSAPDTFVVVTGGTEALLVDSAQDVYLANPLKTTQGGTSLTAYTTGDILYASAPNTLSKLAVGANNYVLTVAAGVPAWTAAAASGVSSVSFGSTGLTPSTATTGAISVAGTLASGFGGTGNTTYTNGQLLIGNTTTGGLSKATLTAGANITITNSAGGIEIAAAAATGVASVSFGSTGLTPSTATTGAVSVAGTLATGSGGTGLTTFTAANRALYSTSSSALTAGTLPVAAGGTGGTTQSTARSGLGLGGMATQSDVNVSITGGVATGMSAVRVGTSGSLSVSEGMSVFAGVNQDGFVSRMTTNAYFNFVGQNASGTETFSVSGNGLVTAATGDANGFKVGNAGVGVTTAGLGSVNVDSLTSFYGNNTSSGFFQNGQQIWSSTAGSADFTLNNGITPRAYGTTTWTNLSDRRVKKDITDYGIGLNSIKQLRPVNYKFNGQYGTSDDGLSYVGFVAQEVADTSLLSMVGPYSHTDTTTGTTTELLSVNTSELIFALVNAVKELSARIEALEAKVP